MCPHFIVKLKTAILRSAFFAILLFTAGLNASEFIAITEILKNPIGPSNGIPGDASHECIEITNLGSDTFFIDSLFLFDNPGGIDSIVTWDTLKYGPLAPHEDCIFNASVIAPGASALILDQDYFTALQVQPSSHFSIDARTTILTVNRKDIGNGGLSNTDGIAIFKGTPPENFPHCRVCFRPMRRFFPDRHLASDQTPAARRRFNRTRVAPFLPSGFYFLPDRLKSRTL